VAFGILVLLVIVTTAVATLIALEEGKLGTNSAIIIVAVYGFAVIALEVYRVWAHTMRVRTIMESAHKLQENLASAITEVSQSHKVRRRSGRPHARCPPPLTCVRSWMKPSCPSTDASAFCIALAIRRVCSSAIPRCAPTPAPVARPHRCVQVIDLPSVLRRIRSHESNHSAHNRVVGTDENNKLAQLLLFCGAPAAGRPAPRAGG
jgi:hypothetical protein